MATWKTRIMGVFGSVGIGFLSSEAEALARQEKGSMTMQVIVFSLLLLGTTGVVLDSGRVYATHSQMQAFADWMALTAAAELDRKDDSVARARAAVEGISVDAGGTGAPFLADAEASGVSFVVERLEFFTDMTSGGAGRQSDLSDMATFKISDEAGNSAQARYVAVYVEKMQVFSVASALAQISERIAVGSDGDDDTNAGLGKSAVVGAVAVAGLKIERCADTSTVVLCNPFEDRGEGTATWEERRDADELEGLTVQYFAPNFAAAAVAPTALDGAGGVTGQSFGSPFPYDERNQVFKLRDPVSDPSGICSDVNLAAYLQLPGEDVTSSMTDYLRVRDRCLMARAKAERHCFGETIGIAAAEGPEIARSLNTAFDIYHEPFASLLANDFAVANSGLSAAQFFQPDLLTSTPYELAWTAQEIADFNTAHGEWSANKAAAEAAGTAFTDPEPALTYPSVNSDHLYYPTLPSPNHIHLASDIFMGFDFCFADTMTQYTTGATGILPCAQDFVGDRRLFDIYTTNYVRDYLGDYYNLSRGSYDPRTRRTTPGDARLTRPQVGWSWYELYQDERSGIYGAGSTTYTQKNGGAGPTDALKSTDEALTDYYALTSGLALFNADNTERRHLRTAVVNCRAARANAPDASGTYQAELLALAEVYITRPPSYFCGTDATTGLGIPRCDVDQQVETITHVELLDDITEEAFLTRFTPMLVR